MTSESEAAVSTADGSEPRRLTFDLDVDVCVIGAGLAGLTVALECARLGASVAVLEGRRAGWNASGHPFGTVMPGYGVPAGDLVARVGLDHARELWRLSQQGADHVRALAGEALMEDLALSEGALEVSNVDIGEQLRGRLQMLSEGFGTAVEGWDVDRVRATLKTRRYFQALHYPAAFQIDGRRYFQGLMALAKQAGVRLFEDTSALSIDASGIRKRIVTPAARMRASHVVLAGNVHLGEASRRLTRTLLPVWRYAAVTEPLGERLAAAPDFQGAVMDIDGIDHFRILRDGRLMWSSPETTWAADPQRFRAALRRRIRTVFPGLKRVALSEIWGGTVGQTVHGMPQIGQLRPGLWVASGFGRQGLNTSALAGQLIARSILWGDDRWRLFSPFELVWAGGTTGRAAGHAIGIWNRGRAAAGGALARWRERAGVREVAREARRAAVEARLAAANRRAGTTRPQ